MANEVAEAGMMALSNDYSDIVEQEPTKGSSLKAGLSPSVTQIQLTRSTLTIASRLSTLVGRQRTCFERSDLFMRCSTPEIIA